MNLLAGASVASVTASRPVPAVTKIGPMCHRPEHDSVKEPCASAIVGHVEPPPMVQPRSGPSQAAPEHHHIGGAR